MEKASFIHTGHENVIRPPPWITESLALCLITIFAACFLQLYACLTCSSVHASSLHPLLAHWECRWLQQRLSLAVVRGNAASILACVQV